MKTKPPMWIAAATATLFCLAYGVHRAQAGGLPVFDAANLTQNILTAIRTLQSNMNEAQQIVNQMQSLENEFLNLESLEFSVIDDYRSQFEALFEAVGRVNGLVNDYAALEERFEELYPDWSHETELLPSEEVAVKTKEWLEKSRKAVLGASLTGAKVLENLPETQAQLGELVQNSQEAVGILQAAQAGNQIAAQVAGNLTNLNAQLAKYTEAHMSYLMKLQQEEAAGKNNLDHALDSIYEGRKIVEKAPLQPY